MSKVNFQELFKKSNGEEVLYEGETVMMVCKIPLHKDNTFFQLEILKTNSTLLQGIALKTEGYFVINNQSIKEQIVLWENSAPTPVKFYVKSKNQILYIYNVWITNDKVIDFWNNNSAMKVVESGSKKTFYCNDGYGDKDFDNIIFTIDMSQEG